MVGGSDIFPSVYLERPRSLLDALKEIHNMPAMEMKTVEDREKIPVDGIRITACFFVPKVSPA